ncbi:MAG TPA: FAD-binding and (Fe-S)-binding domain-containing protein [Pirellulales bacterium]|nr:FAD-binding and (Fe-S)-binding domain-containing protein [Pirellulales bacterium]
MQSLTVLRNENEHERFQRQRRDDSRTAIEPGRAAALAAELRAKLDGEVRFDDGSRALYATDGSNYRQAPIGVVIPKHDVDVMQTVSAAHRYGAPILSRGGGTSLGGQCCNVAVVMDFSKYMHHVLRIDADRRLGVVQPGCVLDDLRDAAKQHGLTFGPDPSTHNHCTLGGMLGNDSCGAHSLLCAKHDRGLRTADNTHELEVLTYDGLRMRVGATSSDELAAIIRQGGPRGQLYAKLKAFRDKYADEIRQNFPQLPRRVSGYNLDALLPENGFHVARALVGSEATLVTILEATLNLVPEPRARSLVIFGYPDIYEACNHLMEILEFKPTALEGFDHLLFKFVEQKGDKNADLKLLPPGKGFLIVEFGGDSKDDADEQARACIAKIESHADAPHMELLDDPRREQMIWKVREGGLGATAWVPGRPDGWPGWEDSAVPPERIRNYLPALRKLFQKYGYEPSLYGHFGQGCVHCRVGFDLYTTQGIQKFNSFMNEAADLVVSFGGSLSGEHGDGQARGEFLPKMFGDTLYRAFREFKAIWDPHGKMNPGKKIDAYGVTENLRLGADYNPPQPSTHFHFPDDRASFARAALRCVGVGECRKAGGQVMCPSYQVTREEKNSTRGRAHLLFEMMNGEVLTDGWRSEAVKDALDLCLACKGCKGECPVNVDMATYKAEFLSHYYAGRLRPRYAYSMGWIHWWARLAALAPGVANFFSQTPVLRDIAKWLGGIDPRRKMPPFARETFKSWFQRRGVRNLGKPQVLLWPDTFNNHFHPETGRAAVEVLEAAGFQVLVPTASLCCGRPLYDFGMLDMAKRLLREILDTLRPQIQNGVPLVGLEPSCLAVFRDELVNLFPDDEDAKRLHKQSFLLSEFLNRKVDGYQPPHIDREAIVHGHCHHKALMKMDDELELLKKMGLRAETPEPGCCGMAGSFGFERGGHYDVSMACAERALLPAVREVSDETLVIANGFSCQQQIFQSTGRRPLHLAEVLQMAMHGGLPRQSITRTSDQPKRGRATAALVCAAAAVALSGWIVWNSKYRETY